MLCLCGKLRAKSSALLCLERLRLLCRSLIPVADGQAAAGWARGTGYGSGASTPNKATWTAAVRRRDETVCIHIFIFFYIYVCVCVCVCVCE
jgi:hypothetical protein